MQRAGLVKNFSKSPGGARATRPARAGGGRRGQGRPRVRPDRVRPGFFGRDTLSLSVPASTSRTCAVAGPLTSRGLRRGLTLCSFTAVSCGSPLPRLTAGDPPPVPRGQGQHTAMGERASVPHGTTEREISEHSDREATSTSVAPTRVGVCRCERRAPTSDVLSPRAHDRTRDWRRGTARSPWRALF